MFCILYCYIFFLSFFLFLFKHELYFCVILYSIFLFDFIALQNEHNNVISAKFQHSIVYAFIKAIDTPLFRNDITSLAVYNGQCDVHNGIGDPFDVTTSLSSLCFTGRVLIARLIVPEVWLSAAVNGYDDLLQLHVYRHISLIRSIWENQMK